MDAGCSVSCGGGKEVRVRVCSSGRNDCPGNKTDVTTADCNTQTCSEKTYFVIIKDNRLNQQI